MTDWSLTQLLNADKYGTSDWYGRKFKAAGRGVWEGVQKEELRVYESKSKNNEMDEEGRQ